ncbi:6765_t:CDS:2 [Cetraspora pellucida]|uniref:6765_t:CDS:1 n=1 Tax=Cetraspora pellucida TaxID=1433469 RepID=A0ACA9LJF7_9GLOM|nr:6765_t:CDS:2 [Cetraspora pellucida]
MQLYELVEELIKVFELFNQATEVFSDEKYSMLSIVYPIIEVLKFDFAIDPSLPFAKDDNFIEEYVFIQTYCSPDITSTNHYFASIFDNNDNDENDRPLGNELDKYLNTNKVPIVSQTTQSLSW